MKRKSLAFLLALSMVFGNSAGVLAANAEDTYIEIEDTNSVADSEEIVIASDEESVQDEMASSTSGSSEEENAIEISDVDGIEIEDASQESSSDENVTFDKSLGDIKIPNLTYMDVELENLASPDVTADASFNANSNYTAEKYITPNLPPLRDQNPYGTCWAHTSLALAEISLITKGVATKNIDFSELHLAYFTYNSIVDPLGGTEGDFNKMTFAGMSEGSKKYAFMERGGNLVFSQNILASWLGAADEATVPYEDAAQVLDNYNTTGKGLSDSVAFEDAAHMTHYFDVVMPNYLLSAYDSETSSFKLVENPNFMDEFAPVKKLIVDYGAVGISYNASTDVSVNGVSYRCYNSEHNAFYFPARVQTNHAVTVVGWDDNFSKSYFNHTPPGDGAWLVRNSWIDENSEYFTEKDKYSYSGYFWMSYYDATLDRDAYAFDFEEGSNYEHNYQYDGGMNSIFTYGKKAANVFTVSGGSEAEVLKAVSFATDSVDQNYTIEIYTDLTKDDDPTSGELAATLSGKTDYQGYYTIPLEKDIILSKGVKFSVVLSLTSKDGSDGYYTVESSIKSSNVWYWVETGAKAGQSFIYRTSWKDEGSWSDYGATYKANIRIKAFTDDASSVDTTGISFEKASYTLDQGDEIAPVVTIAPSNATNKKYKLESSDSSVVKVDGTKLIGMNAGTATITATTAKGGFKATTTVTVNGTYTFEIEGEKYPQKGDTVNYKVVITPSNAVVKQDIVFTSSNTDVLVIDSRTGAAKGVGLGYSTVTASIGGRNAYLDVTVGVKIPEVISEVGSDNTITLSWKQAEGNEEYSIHDDAGNLLEGNIQPDAKGNCSYVDKRYVGMTVEKNFIVWFEFTVYEKGWSGERAVQVKLNSKKYTVTYVLNGATNDSRNPETFYESSYVPLYDAVAPAGSVFEGWYTNAKFTGSRKTAINPDDKKDLTLYAKISSKKSVNSIEYVLNGGTNHPGNPTSYKTGNAAIKLKNPTREGYTFAGWFADKDFATGKVTTIKKNSTGSLTFYAKWTANKYTVKFNGNGGSGSMSAMKLSYDSAGNLKKNTITRKGYTFVNWNTRKDGSGVTYSDEQSVLNLTTRKGGAVTLYAQWTANTYTVKFETNGGTLVSENPISYKVTDKVKSIKLEKPVRPGYVFNGWYKQYADGKFKGKVSQISKKSATDYNLYAKWTEIKYTIKFNGNKGAKGKMDSLAKVSAIEKVNLPENQFEKAGYRFVGWNTKANGSGVSVKDKAELLNPTFITKNGQTVTLYAQWEAVN